MSHKYEAKKGTVEINESGEIRVNGVIAFYSAPENNQRDYQEYCNMNDGIRKHGGGQPEWSQGMYDG